MNGYWDGYKTRRVLKNWYKLTHQMGQLSLNNLKYLQQLYYRLSYLTLDQQKNLANLFYLKNPKAKVTDYVKKAVAQLKAPKKGPNQSLSSIRSIQFKGLINAFKSDFRILKTKLKSNSDLRALNQICDEDFGTHQSWSLVKCQNELKVWYFDCHQKVSPRRAVITRQLLYRISYLKPHEKGILKKMYYHPKNKFPRSEALAKQLNLNLETLLIIRIKAIKKLRLPKSRLKAKFSADERWQLKNNQEEIQAIIKNVFLANF